MNQRKKNNTISLMKITRNPRVQQQTPQQRIVNYSVNRSHQAHTMIDSRVNSHHPLCDDCDALKYCQLARNLSHNHGAHFNSLRIINGAIGDRNTSPSKTTLLDEHILAEKLKIRYKTCPFHRELSLG